MSYLKTQADRLIGLDLPVPVRSALAGEPLPLAISTRDDLPGWCERHGYNEEQAATLSELIGAIARSRSYQLALAADLSRRMTLDGEDAGEVTEAERLRAAKVALAMALKNWKGKLGSRTQAVAALALSDEKDGEKVLDRLIAAPDQKAGKKEGSIDLSFTVAAPSPQTPAKGPLYVEPRVLTVKTLKPATPAAKPPVRAPAIPPAFRGVVERAGIRRGALRLLAIHRTKGQEAAFDAELAGWRRDACQALAAGGYEVVERQVDAALADIMVGAVPARGRVG